MAEVILIQGDIKNGRLYNFWDTSVFTFQNMFLDRDKYEMIRTEHPFAKYINCVRFLGGIQNEKDDYFRGVGLGDEAICDFTYALELIQGILDCGFIPRIVLDNVPTQMTNCKKMHAYGNTLPPDDPKVWNSYIRQLFTVMVNRFGNDRVKSWRIRVGTEPDLYPGHWSGSQVQYYKHYDNTVDAVTQIIPNADIGPGNILDPMENPRAIFPYYKFGNEIIDHCCGEFNFTTNCKGSRMNYFATSWYGHVGLDNNRFDEAVADLRNRLNKYSGFEGTPVEIHEFAVLTDENRTRLYNGDASEWGASWMADIAERTYRLNVAQVYQWATTTYGVWNPRSHVLSLLEKMVGCEKLQVDISGEEDINTASEMKQEKYGCIASFSPENREYRLMLYRHNPDREELGYKNLKFEIIGKNIENGNWFIKELFIIDKYNSGYIREMYEDMETEGVRPLEVAPYFGADLEKRFGSDGMKVFEKNRQKYSEIGKLKQINKADIKLVKKENSIKFELDMASHSVYYLTLEQGMK